MFAAQRMEIIKQMVKEQKRVNVATLTETLNVSDVTVRKYLDTLERQGVLMKVHGGAIWIDENEPEPFDTLDRLSNLEVIGDLAATLVEDGDSLFIGPGSTCAAFARKLTDKQNISVITNNPEAVLLMKGKVSNISLIGGDVGVRSNGFTYVYGSRAIYYLENIYINKAFIGCDGLEIETGVTGQALPLIEVLLEAIKISHSVFALATADKIGKLGLHRICPISRLQAIVTDYKTDDRFKKYCYENNIKLLTAYKQI